MSHAVPDDTLRPRPRLLSRRLDHWSEAVIGGLGRKEPLANPSEVLETAGRDAGLYAEMLRTESSLSAAVALRTDKAAAHGSGFVAGEGDRAELLRMVAEGIWNFRGRATVEREVIRSWAMGVTIHEAFKLRRFAVEGKECVGPRALHRVDLAHVEFTQDDDLVLLPSGDRTENRTLRTDSVDHHRDALKMMVSSHGDSGSPYGAAVLDDVWLDWVWLGELWTGFRTGLHGTNGLLEIAKRGVSARGAGQISVNLSLAEAKTAADEIQRFRSSDGILIGLDGFEAKILDYKGSAETWLAAIQEKTKSIRIRILGSELSQAMPSSGRGSFAAAKVQDRAPESAGRFDVDSAAENITRYVDGWLFVNFPGETLDEAELPRWESRMGKVPSAEDAQALVAMGAPVDLRQLARDLKVALVDKKPDKPLVAERGPPVVVAPAVEEEDDEDGSPEDQVDVEEDEDG